MVDKIACFLTCGYTEAGAMQFFLKKINSNFDYKQYLPNKTIKKKGTPKMINSHINGLTGEDLLEKIYLIVSKHREEIGKCKAIIIEDDLDGRFCEYNSREIDSYKKNIVSKIHENLGKEIPVFILYASPEIESWFIADWENGFDYLYCNSTIVKDVEDKKIKSFFSHNLRNYINNKILKEYAENIEEFGYFEGKYLKLSNQISKAIDIDVKMYIKNMHSTDEETVRQIVESRDLYYSKRLHGDLMLRNISPEVIAEKCRKYFREPYYKLKELSDNEGNDE